MLKHAGQFVFVATVLQRHIDKHKDYKTLYLQIKLLLVDVQNEKKIKSEKLFEMFILSVVSFFNFCDFMINYTFNTWETFLANLKQTNKQGNKQTNSY